MSAGPVVLAILLVVATLAAPVTADWRRRLATRRFDAVYERNLLRRSPFSASPPASATGRRRPGRGR